MCTPVESSASLENCNENECRPNKNTLEMDFETEAPLSPILNNSKMTRKMLSFKRKSRVKVNLNNKFHDKSNAQLSTIAEQDSAESSTAIADGRSANVESARRKSEVQKKTFGAAGERIRKIKEYEEETEQFYENVDIVSQQIKRSNEERFNFKVPYPKVHVSERSHIAVLVGNVSSLGNRTDGGFKTATGRAIVLNEDALKRSMKLFDDLLHDFEAVPLNVDENEERVTSRPATISDNDERLLNSDLKLFEDFSERSVITDSESDLLNAECSGFTSCTSSGVSFSFEDETISQYDNSEAVSTTNVEIPVGLTESLERFAASNTTETQMIEVAVCAERIDEDRLDWNSVGNRLSDLSDTSVPNLISNSGVKDSRRRFFGFDDDEIKLSNKLCVRFNSKIPRLIRAVSKRIEKNTKIFNVDAESNSLTDDLHSTSEKLEKKLIKLKESIAIVKQSCHRRRKRSERKYISASRSEDVPSNRSSSNTLNEIPDYDEYPVIENVRDDSGNTSLTASIENLHKNTKTCNVYRKERFSDSNKKLSPVERQISTRHLNPGVENSVQSTNFEILKNKNNEIKLQEDNKFTAKPKRFLRSNSCLIKNVISNDTKSITPIRKRLGINTNKTNNEECVENFQPATTTILTKNFNEAINNTFPPVMKTYKPGKRRLHSNLPIVVDSSDNLHKSNRAHRALLEEDHRRTASCVVQIVERPVKTVQKQKLTESISKIPSRCFSPPKIKTTDGLTPTARNITTDKLSASVGRETTFVDDNVLQSITKIPGQFKRKCRSPCKGSIINVSSSGDGDRVRTGFNTALGRSVVVSNNSLKKAEEINDGIAMECVRDVLEDLPIELFSDFNSDNDVFVESDKQPPIVSGFATAGGKKLELSKTRLVEAEKKFAEDSEYDLIQLRPKDLSKNSLENALKSFTATTKSSSTIKTHINTPSCFPPTNNNVKIVTAESTLSKRTKDDVVDIPTNDFLNSFDEILLKPSRDVVQNAKITSGFSTAGGSMINISKTHFLKARSCFAEESEKVTNMIEENVNERSIDQLREFRLDEHIEKSSIRDQIILSIKNPRSIKKSLNDQEFGFCTAAGKQISVSEQGKESVKSIFNKFEDLLNEGVFVEAIAHGTSSSYALKDSKNYEREQETYDKIITSNVKELVGCDIKGNDQRVVKNIPRTVENSPPRKRQKFTAPLRIKGDCKSEMSVLKEIDATNKTQQENSPKRKKQVPCAKAEKIKTLGPQFCQTKILDEQSLKKAKDLFDDFDFSDMNLSYIEAQNSCSSPRNSTVSRSSTFIDQMTPEKSTYTLHSSTPNDNTNVNRNRQNVYNNFVRDTCLTPIKEVAEPNDDSSDTRKSQKQKRHHITFQQNKCLNINQWEINIIDDYEKLNEMVQILKIRIEAVKYQKQIIESGSADHRRPKPGRLFKMKRDRAISRISLRKSVNNSFPECRDEVDADLYEIAPEILKIVPENTIEVHFTNLINANAPNNHKSASEQPVLNCTDGAIIIPNKDDTIGFLQIECGFKSMPGVDPTIIPNGWISNHFTWIVWKFAGMERCLPLTFKGCLCVDNILQQLKYRYDREIDNVERSALRKILEKDDVAGKRIILCVSAIVEISSRNYELDLTDGWYKIRTAIDVPLMQQVHKKIKVGTKLLIFGAELMNCADGCSPLAVPAAVRLRINYNSTRRAKWDTKLGYQPIPTPFSISLRSVHLNGGIVRCATVYIARVYPLKFMEKLNNGGTVWRNSKAEQKKTMTFENEKQDNVERARMKVEQQMEHKRMQSTRKHSTRSIRSMKRDEIQNINCPQTLSEMLEQTADPDSFRELLTSSQQELLWKYQANVLISKQDEISTMIKTQLGENNLERNVVPILKLLIIDANAPSDYEKVLSIWRPKEAQIKCLLEGKVALIYNVLPKSHSRFSSTSHTNFQIVQHANDFIRYKRTVTSIPDTMKNDFLPAFGEFDTVGLIVKIDTKSTGQALWLVHSNFQFLHVTIAEGPQTCSLLDGLETGNLVAVSNLLAKSYKNCFSTALADHYTIISRYSQETYLKEGLEILNSELNANNMATYMVTCIRKVETFVATLEQRTSSVNPLKKDRSSNATGYSNDFSILDDGTLLNTRLTDTDIAMSLIDTEEYIS